MTVGTWSYGYDAGGRLTSLTNPYSETTTWAYDGEGKLTGQFNANGTNTAYAYNQQRGWPTSITHSLGSSVFASYGLTYDNGSNTVGNLTGVTEADGSTVSYGYDALYRLTGEARTGTAPGGHTFGYDLAGNLTNLDSGTATYDSANKITSTGFSYDGDGDLTSDGTTAYTWDDRSDLVSRTAGGMTTAYGYDGQGLRVVSQVGLGIKTFYVFAGDTLIGEINGAGVVQAAYTWGAAGLVSERLMPSSASLWYHFGPQGETRQLTDSTGSVADSYVYSAYGQPVASVGTDANPFRFGGVCGYYTDSAVTSGAVLCTHRWYDPNTARWLSRDPIGYEGGDNLYSYTFNDPVNLSDPSGLDSDDNPWEYLGSIFDSASPSDWWRWITENGTATAVGTLINIASYIPDPASPGFDVKVGQGIEVSVMHILNLSNPGWRKTVFSMEGLVYVLKDANTGEALKVGQTTSRKFVGRFERYVAAGNYTRRKLSLEVFETPLAERGKVEGALRKTFGKYPPNLPWDNAGRPPRLGRKGPGVPCAPRNR